MENKQCQELQDKEIGNESSREALAFADRIEQKKRRKVPNLLGIAVVLLIAVSYSVTSYGVDIPAWAIVIYLFAIFGGIIGVLTWKSKSAVRESYRQDPKAESNKVAWAFLPIIMVPMFVRPFAEGNLVLSVLIGLFIVAGFAWIWRKNPEWL